MPILCCRRPGRRHAADFSERALDAFVVEMIEVGENGARLRHAV